MNRDPLIEDLCDKLDDDIRRATLHYIDMCKVAKVEPGEAMASGCSTILVRAIATILATGAPIELVIGAIQDIVSKRRSASE